MLCSLASLAPHLPLALPLFLLSLCPEATPAAPTMARTMSALELVHAFHCTRHICPDSTCAEAKDALRRVEAHCLTCSLRIIERDAEDGTPAQCKMCRLWAALHRTRLVSTTAVCQPCEFAPKLTDAHARGVQSAVPKYHDDIVGLELRADRRAQAGRRVGWSDGMCSSVWFKARQRVRQLGPAQVRTSPPNYCPTRHPQGGRTRS